MSKHDKSSHSEKIIVNCLKIDACLKTLYKALNYDENNIEEFGNDYLWMIEEALDINWFPEVTHGVTMNKLHKF